MNYFSFSNIEIKAIASAVPNEYENLMDYVSLFPTEELDKFCKTTGIYRRYVGYRKKIITSDLCVAAANKIFQKFSAVKDELDAIIFMTQTPDYHISATSAVIQARLGLTHCAAVYDITYGCAAFPFGLQIAGGLIKGGCRNVLLLIGDTVSPGVGNKEDLLFGDAGCAIVVGEKNREYPSDMDTMQIRLETIGEKYQKIMFPFGGHRHKYADIIDIVGKENAAKLVGKRFMNGPDVFTFSIKDAPIAVKRFYEHFNCSADDFDFAAIHQANQMIVDRVAKRIAFPKEKVPISLDRYANTSGATVPLTICDYFERTHMKGIKRVLTVAFGVGMAIGVCSCTIDSEVCFPVIRTEDSYDDGIDYARCL